MRLRAYMLWLQIQTSRSAHWLRIRLSDYRQLAEFSAVDVIVGAEHGRWRFRLLARLARRILTWLGGEL